MICYHRRRILLKASELIKIIQSVIDTDGDIDVMMSEMTRNDGTLCDHFDTEDVNIWGCSYDKDSGMYMEGSPKTSSKTVLIIG